MEKQIRHLQRQAATARRYQTLKEEERKLQAEVLALRLQSLDVEAGVRDAAAVSCETAMQGVIADLRDAEARIETVRADQSAKAEQLSAIQARFYEAGAEVTRIEQSIQYARELRQRQRCDLEQVESRPPNSRRSATRPRSIGIAVARAATMVPGLDAAHERGTQSLRSLCRAASRRSPHGSSAWDTHAQAVAQGQRETQVERARIEQLESQQRRLLQQQERQQTERADVRAIEPPEALEKLAQRAERRPRSWPEAPRPSCK